MSTEIDELRVPEISMGWKNFVCPTCYASVFGYVDTNVEHREQIPHELEMHLQWHDRNDRS